MKNFLFNKRVFIIAEAGVNHNGDLKIAKKLVLAARKSGADAVKFQTFRAEQLASASAKTAGYQCKTVGNGKQVEMLRLLELSVEDHYDLLEYCHKEKIIFLSTPFDQQSVDFLVKLGVKAFKIASGEVTNTPFLKEIAQKQRPVILSTGMATLDEVARAVRTIHSTGNKDLTLLHCVTEYPAPFDQVNLRAMETMRKAFDLQVGFSDHTPGIWMSVAAVAMGAVLIEKHLTLDRSLPGPDHKASLEPEEFTQMVKAIRAVESALGDGIKRPAACEKKYIFPVRKSLVAARDMPKGFKIGRQDFIAKRPGTGISPDDLEKIIGKKLKKAIRCDEILKKGHLT